PNQRPQAPPEPSPRRNHVTSTTAARSLEGDSRPIFGGGGGRGRDLVTTNPTNIQESIPPPPAAPGLQRRGTFVLEESTLPNLPQSGAQRPRDTVIVP
ncbi:unnamed protein product, partial [Rotaria magnacalcarata]